MHTAPPFSPPQLAIRILPMMVVSWSRVFSLILPGLIKTFDLSLDQAGLCVTALETGGFLSMLALSLAIDRWGAVRLLSGFLLVAAAALFLTTVAPSYEILLLVFFLLGAGTASTASAVNALMASTGERRGFYLGIVHSAFGLFSIAAPLVAGALIVYSGWRAYHLLVGLLALMVALVFYAATRTTRAAWRPLPTAAIGNGAFNTFRRIGPICLGVSTLVGVQGVFNSWSYLYVLDRFSVEHATAVLAPACIWTGILLGRTSHTFLSRRFSARFLLTASCLLAASAVQGVHLAPFFWLAALALIGVGMGVGGAYQLGTAWAAERAPERIGAASTFIMASAALGAGIWPWITGMVVEAGGFQNLVWVVSGALGLGALAFYAGRNSHE